MSQIYDYKSNIKVITTPSGDKVLTMNEAIYTEILVNLKEAERHQRQEGRNATADSTDELWLYLNDDECLDVLKK